MKKYILAHLMIGVALVVCFVACKKDNSLKNPAYSTTGSSFISLVDAAPNFRLMTGFADSFNVFVNNTKLTGFTPSGTYVMTYNNGYLYPTASANSGYVEVPAGVQTIRLSVAGVVNPDSIPIISLTKNFAANKYYTLMISDSIKLTNRDSAQIFVRDSFPAPTPGFYNLRFINTVFNDTAGKTIDIWSTRANRTIFTGIKAGMATGFTQFPSNALYSDTFFVRHTGNISYNLDTLLSITYATQRTYTLFYRGNANSNVSIATNPKRRHLYTYVNQ